MRILIAAAALASLLTGCAGPSPTPEQVKQAQTARYQMLVDLDSAPWAARTTCADKTQCDNVPV